MAFEVFDIIEKDIPVGYKKVHLHIIIHVKTRENFHRKYPLVGRGHKTFTL